MSIAFSCPKCDSPMKVADDLAGRRLRCAHCGGTTTVPDVDNEDSDDGVVRTGRGRRSLRRKDTGVATFYRIFIGSGIAIFAFMVLVIVVVFAAPGSVVAVDEGLVNGVKTTNGVIGFNDHIAIPRRMLGKTHKVTLKKNQSYIIDHRSGAFDAYLILLDANGRIVSEDDDGGGGLDSRIIFRPMEDGEYRIVATSLLGNETGPYTLTIREENGVAAPPPAPPIFAPFPAPKAQPGPAPQPGSAIPAPLVNGRFETNNVITFGDNVANRDWLGKVYEVEFRRDQKYQIDLISGELDAFLYVCTSNGNDILAFDDDSGGNFNARVLFTPAVAGKYRIVATSLGHRGMGPFTLRIAEAGRTEESKPPTLALLVNGKFAANDAIELGDAVFGIPNVTRALARQYDVDMRSDRRYSIDLISSAFDSYLYVLGDDGRVLAVDDDSGDGLNARLLFSPPKIGRYRVVATSLSKNSTGRFSFQIAELQKDAAAPPVPRPPAPVRPDPRNPATPAKLVAGEFEAKGRITSGDRLQKTGTSVGKAYEIELTANRTYRIDLDFDAEETKSSLAVPKIIIESAQSNTNLAQTKLIKGKTVQLTYTPSTTGPVWIVATSYNLRSVGAFALRVREEK